MRAYRSRTLEKSFISLVALPCASWQWNASSCRGGITELVGGGEQAAGSGSAGEGNVGNVGTEVFISARSVLPERFRPLCPPKSGMAAAWEARAKCFPPDEAACVSAATHATPRVSPRFVQYLFALSPRAHANARSPSSRSCGGCTSDERAVPMRSCGRLIPETTWELHWDEDEMGW